MATHLDSTDLNIILLGLDDYQITVNVRREGSEKSRAAQRALIQVTREKIEALMDAAMEAETLEANR